MSDVLASGSVADRPWGQTLGALGLKGLTGQLTLEADDKEYCLAFENGAVVAASSPLVADAVARIALTNQLVSSTQVADITRRVAAAPDRDELDVLAEATRLSPEQIHKLRRRMVAQRAARTFSVDRGEFVVEAAISLPVVAGCELDIRAVIYLGARMNLSEQRLAYGLRHFGAHFVLKQDALDSLAQFGFTEDERTILEELRMGTSLPEIEAKHREVDPRTAQAVMYALACCNACEIQRAQPSSPQIEEPAAPRTRTESAAGAAYNFVSRTSTKQSPPTPQPVSPRALSATQAPVFEPPISRTLSSPSVDPDSPVRFRTPTAPNLKRSDVATVPPPNVDRANGGTTPPPSRAPTAPPASRTVSGQPIDPDSASRLRTPTAPDASRTLSSPNVGRTATGTGSPDGRPPTTPPPSRGGTGPIVSRTSSLDGRPPTTPPPSRGGAGPVASRTGTPTAAPSRGGTGPIVSRAATPTAPPVSRTTTGPVVSRTATGPNVGRASTDRRTLALVAARMMLLEKGADYFALLGVPFDAPTDVIRTAYLNLSIQFHPERLGALEGADATNAAGLFKAMSAAFAELTDPVRRAIYLDKLQRDELTPPPRVSTEELLGREDTGPGALKRGELALRRDDPAQAVIDLMRACELEPTNFDYAAMLGWAQFCAASDKREAYPTTRKMLDKAILRGTKPLVARFLLGRVERILGRDREALRHFLEVLDEQPNHAEAKAEVRAIELRLSNDKSRTKRPT